MTEVDYMAWTEYHRALFQMKSADDSPMFAKWFPSLVEFSLEEAKSASLSIAGDARAAKFRTEHLALIRIEIKRKRYERIRAELSSADGRLEAQRCRLCSGTGLVFVPHIHSIVDDRWAFPFSSMVVSCTCNAGSFKLNSANSLELKQDKGHGRYRVRMMDLREYEMTQPNWQGLMSERLTQQQSEFEAGWHAREADKKNPIDSNAVAAAVAAIGVES